MNDLDLTTLLASISKSVSDAAHNLEAYGLGAYRRHFQPVRTSDAAEPEAVAPTTVRLALPKADGTYEPKDVPTVALLHHGSLQMDEVQVRLKVRVKGAGANRPLEVELAPLAKGAGTEGDPGAANEAEIDLLFRRSDSPEGIARVTKQFHQAI